MFTIKMASPTAELYCCSLILLIYCMLPSLTSFQLFKPNNILHASSSFCLVLFPDDILTDKTEKLLNTLADVSFKNETDVLFGRLKEVPLNWPNGRPLEIIGNFKREELQNSVLLFKRLKQDRTCLLVPEDNFNAPPVVPFKLSASEVDDKTLDHIVDHINGNCATFRTEDGSLNFAGIHRKEILESLFSTSKSSMDHHSLLKQCLESKSDQNNNQFCRQNSFTESYDPVILQAYENFLTGDNLQECERIEMPTASQFFHDYLSRSKPVIIKGAMQNWLALQKWTNKFLRENFGDQKVHIKITPDGEYEGVEPISLWEGHKTFNIPKSVYGKLPHPNLVVVRPASMEIVFSEFLDLIENVSLGRVKNISAYLEYSSITEYFPGLMKDVKEMPFFTNVMELKHLNIWLSDGNTLGKLHFDPFDNFLCQISGEKEVLLFEPHDNTRLYEGHIQEAMLTYNASEKLFYRKKLLDSTSMVMSPVDLLKPDYQRFPKFAEIRPMKCTIQAGDVLFMPSFWWHEVQSRPDISEHRNLAVNFWYEPFLTREFPCPECKLDINFKYSHLL